MKRPLLQHESEGQDVGIGFLVVDLRWKKRDAVSAAAGSQVANLRYRAGRARSARQYVLSCACDVIGMANSLDFCHKRGTSPRATVSGRSFHCKKLNPPFLLGRQSVNPA